jgi:hypothetical protein
VQLEATHQPNHVGPSESKGQAATKVSYWLCSAIQRRLREGLPVEYGLHGWVLVGWCNQTHHETAPIKLLLLHATMLLAALKQDVQISIEAEASSPGQASIAMAD